VGCGAQVRRGQSRVSGKPGPKSPAHAAKLRAHLVARGFVGTRPPHIIGKGLRTRGCIDWRPLKAKFPIEVSRFLSMHRRVKTGEAPSVEWPRTRAGFIEFLLHVGEVPHNMKHPSIGRLDHDLGYKSGNVVWQEMTINCYISHIRDRLGRWK
jgi:hypothetical protein